MTELHKKKIKIGIDCHKLEDATGAHRAGIGRHLYKLLEEISKRPELVQEFKFYLYFKGTIPTNIPFLKDSIFVLRIAKLPFFFPFFRPSFNIFFHIALPLFAAIDRIDVTFFASFMLPAFFPIAGGSKSIVILTNDIYYEYTQGVQPLKYRIGYRLFSNWAARQATQITTQTHASCDEISSYFNIPHDKISIAPLGVDAFEYAPREKVDKKEYVLYVGQAFPRRHLRETLLAFERIAPEFPRLKFIALGVDKYSPPIIDNLVKKINGRLEEERIIRKEGVNDERLKKLYQRAKLFIYISNSEAMGLPPLEALASGTAPIVADTGTTREIFGNSAYFVINPDDVDNIASTLREALKNDSRRQEIIDSKGEVLEKYTWKKHTDLMLKMFRVVAHK